MPLHVYYIGEDDDDEKFFVGRADEQGRVSCLGSNGRCLVTDYETAVGEAANYPSSSTGSTQIGRRLQQLKPGSPPALLPTDLLQCDSNSMEAHFCGNQTAADYKRWMWVAPYHVYNTYGFLTSKNKEWPFTQPSLDEGNGPSIASTDFYLEPVKDKAGYVHLVAGGFGGEKVRAWHSRRH